MFFLQKLISLCIFSPLIFVILLILGGLYTFRKRKKLGFFIFGSGIFLYFASITPIVNMVASPLEEKIYINSEIESEAYVILGGGATTTSEGYEPKAHALKRIIKGAELYKNNPKPIFISGGSPLEDRISEAEIYKNLLVNLGVPSEDIFVEIESKNTYENALFLDRLFKEKEIKSISLITSAIHLPRSYKTFSNLLLEINITPVKCDFLINNSKGFIKNYIPTFENLQNFYNILWEYVGILFYDLKFFIKNF